MSRDRVFHTANIGSTLYAWLSSRTHRMVIVIPTLYVWPTDESYKYISSIITSYIDFFSYQNVGTTKTYPGSHHKHPQKLVS